eukprot:TRINITY_DN4184_c0_g6_i1.p3 TRINITY_DN4184_c0_g6~~TRINITY_DN4184_c0_g6_i1.p3  ORF type:complete len:239 (-),score=52.99 TRINITY_DN4184_c0_g6_i1:471-1187(-)
MGAAASNIMPGLWHGGETESRNLQFIKENGITHVLSVCPGDKNPHREALKGCLLVPVWDSPSQDLQRHFERIVAFIHRARCRGGVVYVHCQAGISRSTTAVLAYLMACHRLPLNEAHCFVSIRRDVIEPNPGFLAQLRRFEESGAAAQLGQRLDEEFGKQGCDLVQSDLSFIKRKLEQEGPGRMPKDTIDNTKLRKAYAAAYLDAINGNGEDDEEEDNGGDPEAVPPEEPVEEWTNGE